MSLSCITVHFWGYNTSLHFLGSWLGVFFSCNVSGNSLSTSLAEFFEFCTFINTDSRNVNNVVRVSASHAQRPCAFMITLTNLYLWVIFAGAHIRCGGGGVTPPHVLWNISKKSVPKPEWDEKVGPAKIWKILSFCVEKSNRWTFWKWKLHKHKKNELDKEKRIRHTQIRVHWHKPREQIINFRVATVQPT